MGVSAWLLASIEAQTRRVGKARRAYAPRFAHDIPSVHCRGRRCEAFCKLFAGVLETTEVGKRQRVCDRLGWTELQTPWSILHGAQARRRGALPTRRSWRGGERVSRFQEVVMATFESSFDA